MCNKYRQQKLTCLTVQSLTELVDWWGDLQALEQDSLLALEADVLGPADKPAEIPLGLNVLTCTPDVLDTTAMIT